ncbi:MAG: endonuclease III domain-containing protein [Mycobacteriales bacterium]|nr:endonuclease III domain-containing protein [Mycobacteriales bacterium]
MTGPAATLDLVTVAERLLQHYGEEPWWWPVLLPELDRPDELLLGAVLCQQSRWERVEQALLRMSAAGLVTWDALAGADPAVLTPLLVGVAYPPTRARLLPVLADRVIDAGGLRALLAGPDPLAALLALPQVGPETADTLLAFTGTSVPVVDAYLRRVLGRLGLVDPTASYAAVRSHLAQQEAGLPWDVLHALVVEHGIHHCLTGAPRCHSAGAVRRDYAEPRKCATHCPAGCAGHCPLREVCPTAQV